MNAWVMHKQRSLGDILVERGHLKTEDHEFLSRMVERHLTRHGGDAVSFASYSGDS
jgi:hypothetical protein